MCWLQQSAQLWYYPTFLLIPLGVITCITMRRPVMITLAAVAGAQKIASASRAYHLPYDCIPVPDALELSELAAFITLAVAGLLFRFVTVQIHNDPDDQARRSGLRQGDGGSASC